MARMVVAVPSYTIAGLRDLPLGEFRALAEAIDEAQGEQ